MELKLGTLVVLLVNLDLSHGLCNGSQGIVIGWEDYDPEKMPRVSTGRKDNIDPSMRISGDWAHLRQAQIQNFIVAEGVQREVWPIVRFHNGQVRTIYAECSVTQLGDEEPYSILARTQIPLAQAWAMTIHKSQGLTMDQVVVNVSNVFEEGQVYVALSRAKSLDGLKIIGDSADLRVGLGGNPEVQWFLNEKFGLIVKTKEQRQAQLQEEKRADIRAYFKPSASQRLPS